MENTNLSSLPSEMHHCTLSNVYGHNIKDFGAARIVFPRFNEVRREDHFYRSADLFIMNTWYYNGTVVDTFRERCYELGNSEAIYMKGMYELFKLHLIDEGMDKIQDVGNKGLELAKYVDSKLRLTLSVDERGKVNNYPAITRDFVARMAKMLLKLEINLVAWNEMNERPPMFVEAANVLHCVHKCWCNKTDLVWDFRMKGKDSGHMCDSCYWQLEAWRFCDYIHLTAHWCRVLGF